jgi:HAD superfamily hydrolase (TIGR01509 family)
MAQIRLAIFDFDGVLVDSEYLAARVECERYRQHGLDMEVGEFCARFSGLTGAAIFREVEAILGRNLPADLHARIEAELDRVLEREVEAVEGAREVAARIGVPSCICSNSGSARIAAMLMRAGLGQGFDGPVFSAIELDPPAPKPSPEVFRKALRHFALAPREALVIEDSVHGVRAAAAAGARVAGFVGGRHTHPGHADRLTEAGAETVYARHGELPRLIEAFNRWDGAVN